MKSKGKHRTSLTEQTLPLTKAIDTNTEKQGKARKGTEAVLKSKKKHGKRTEDAEQQGIRFEKHGKHTEGARNTKGKQGNTAKSV